MTRYEYRIEPLKFSRGRSQEDQLMETLNLFGQEGWRFNRKPIDTTCPQHRILLLLVFMLCVATGGAWAARMESFGNKPVAEEDCYRAWPGIMVLINDTCRVFSSWTNGDEYFYYRGDTDKLNDFLIRFAAMKSPLHEVTFQPGPGRAQSVEKEKPVPADWRLHVVGGLAAHHVKTDNTAAVWDEQPALTVYVDDRGGIQLDRVRVPKTATVLQMADLNKKYREALRSDNSRVRADAALLLADKDPLNEKNVPLIASLLNDNDAYTRAAAAVSLGSFGALARSALPNLQAASQDKDQQVSALAKSSIEKITNGADQTESIEAFQKDVERINQFVQQLEKHSPSKKE